MLEKKIIPQSLLQLKRLPSLIGAHRIYTAIFLLLVGGVVFWYWHDKSSAIFADVSLYKEPEFLSKEPLRVVQMTPQGELDASAAKKEIAVVFNHPMKDLSIISSSEMSSGAFTIEPAVKGRFIWFGSKVNSFTPYEAYAPSTNYKITLKKGLTALNGKKLQENTEFFFSSEQFKVNSISPYSREISKNEKFIIDFNYPVELSEVKKYVSLDFAGGRTLRGSDLDFDYHKNYDNQIDEKQVICKGRKPWQFDGSFTLRIDKNLKPKGGNIGLKENFTRDYHVYGAQQVSLQWQKDDILFYDDLSVGGLKFKNKVNFNAALKNIEISPKAKKRNDNEDSGYSTDYISFDNWNLNPGATYTAKVLPALKDIDDNPLSAEQLKQSFTFTVPSYRRDFSIATQGYSNMSFMEADIPARFGVQVQGMSQLDTTIDRVSPPALLEFYIKKFNRMPTAQDFGTNAQTQVWKTSLDENKSAFLPYNFTWYSKGEVGWYRFFLRGDVQKRRYDYKTDKTFIEAKQNEEFYFLQVTRLGAVVKQDYKNIHIWVRTLANDTPVNAARVKVYDYYKQNKTERGECVTDAQGYCQVPLKGKPIQTPLFWVSDEKGDNIVLTDNDQANMWSISQLFDKDAFLPKLSGAVVFDSRLYRPGDEAHVKAVLSIRENGKATPMQAPVVCEVTDSRGNNIYKKNHTPSQEGGVWFDLKIPTDAALGHYRVSIFPPKNEDDSNMIFSQTFQVEEYRPVTFTVENRGLQNATLGDEISPQIFARYLFGLPMNGAPFRLSISRKPLNLQMEQYPQYVFGDDDYGDDWLPATFDMFSEKSGKLDSDGTFSFPLKLTELQKENPPANTKNLSRHYELEAEATVTDTDGRSVSNNKIITVYAAKTLPAIYLKDRFHSYERPFEFSFLTLNQNKEPVSSRVEVIIEKKEWKTVLSKSGEDDVHRKTTLVRTPVHSTTLSLGQGETAFSYQVKEAGNYTALIRVKGEASYAQVNFFAYGSGYISWNFADDDKVSLLADKYEYKAGDTARILIQSPFENATAIVSIERESLRESKIIKITSNAHPLEVPILQDYAPNMYVSVVLLRPRVGNEISKNGDSSDPQRPRILFGTLNLKVDISSKYIPLTLETSKEIFHAREKVQLRIRTAPHAEVALAVSDRAVLDLLNYSFPNITKRIYDNWEHGVSVFSNHKYLVQQLNYSGKGDTPGGKGMESLLAMQEEGGFGGESEDGIRKDFRNNAYWAPALKADAQGNIDLSFSLPDNLSTFRMMALAARGGSYAVAEKEIIVEQPLVLQTSLPRFMRVGDELKIGAVLINKTGKDADFTVSLKAALLQSLEETSGEFTQKVFVKNTEAKEITFEVKINRQEFDKLKKNQMLGEKEIIAAKLLPNIMLDGVLRAQSAGGEFKDATKFSFPVKPAPATETVAFSGFSLKQAQEFFTLPTSKEILQDVAVLRFSLSSTVLQNIQHGFDFYQDNPYLCLEQRASLFWMHSIASSLPIFESENKKWDAKKIYTQFIDELKDFQNSDGSFRAWKDSPIYFPELYLSAYIAKVLQETATLNKGNQKFVQSINYQKTLNYLQEQVKTFDKNKYSYEDLVLAMYVLQNAGRENLPLQKFFLQKKKEISLRSKIYLYLSLMHAHGKDYIKNNAQAKELYQDILNQTDFTSTRMTVKEEFFRFAGSYYTRGTAMAALLQLFVETKDIHENANELSFMLVNEIVQHANNLWLTTQSVAGLANSLYLYHQAFEKQMDFHYAVKMSGQNLLQGNFKGFKNANFSKEFLYSELAQKFKPMQHTLLFEKDKDDGRLYYNARFSYSLPQFRSFPLDRGMTLIREVTNIKDKQDEGVIEKRILEYYQSKIPALKRGEMYLYRYTLVVPKPVYSFMLSEFLPSNVEAVQTSFATEAASYGRFLQSKRSSGNEMLPPMTMEMDGEDGDYVAVSAVDESGMRYDFYDDRVDVRNDYLPAGIHEIYFLARPLVKGRSVYPPAKAFAMYEPDFFGTSSSGIQVVE